MVNIALGIFYGVTLAFILAFWEVQIEGKDGHAAKLPCWRKEDGWVVKRILGGTSITGYHVGMYAFLILVFHFIFLFLPWNILIELFILGLLAGFIILEDFFWFLINPYYGLKKFKKSEIHWHKRWLGPVPDFYIYIVAISIVLMYFGYPGVN